MTNITFECSSSSDCNNHGDCVENSSGNNICLCDAAWFNYNCDENLKKQYEEAFWTFQIVFTVLFAVIGIICTRELWNQITDALKYNYQQFWQFLLNTLRSPVNVSMCIIILISLLKVIWLQMDPLIQYDIIDRQLERLLDELVYSLLFALYAVILIVWYSLYQELNFAFANQKNKREKGRCLFGCFKGFVKVRIVTVFIIQIVCSVLKSFRLNPQYRYYIYVSYGFLYLNFALFLFEYIIYGCLVYKCLKLQSTVNLNDNQDQQDSKSDDTIQNGQNKRLINPQKQKDSLNQQQQNSTVNTLLKQRSNHGRSTTTVIKANVTQKSDENQPLKAILEQQQSFEFANKIPSGQQSKSEHQRKELQPDFNLINNINNDFIEKENKFEQDEQLEGVFIQENQIALPKLIWPKNLERINQINQAKLNHIQKYWGEFRLKQNKPLNRLSGYLKQDTINLDFNDEQLQVKNRIKSNKEDNKITQEQMEQIRIHYTDDKKILKKISFLIFFGIFFEISFLILSLIALSTQILNDPQFTMIILYIISFFELLSCLTVIRLFSNVKSKTLDNLRWISRIGSRRNKINQLYLFKLPDHFNDRATKKELERRINHIVEDQYNDQ